MSAYIVDKNHILFLVAAALSRRLNGHFGFSWSTPEGGRRTLRQGDYETAADVANMLWCENIASVSHRYPRESSAELPGSVGVSFVVTTKDIQTAHYFQIDPVQVLKACNCYCYQACEHPAWETSEAKTFVVSLKETAIRALSGYEEAEWGAPKPISNKIKENLILKNSNLIVDEISKIATIKSMKSKPVIIRGVKFGKKGLKDANGNYFPIWYSLNILTSTKRRCITIYAKNYKSLPAVLNAENNSDMMTDYFETDYVRFEEGTPEFEMLKPFCKE